MTAFPTLTWTETKLLFREPAAVFFTLVFPFMLLVIFGSIYGNDSDSGWNGVGAMDITVPGYFGMIIGTVTLLSIPIVISEYRSNGVFRRLRATPLHPMSIIAAHTVINLVMTTAGFVLLYIGGKAMFGLMTPVYPGRLIVVLVLSYVAFAVLGFVIGSTFRTPRTAQVVGNVIYFPQLFLSGATLPREMFSENLRSWTEWMPMVQMANLIKQAWHGDDISTGSIAYLLVMTAISSVIAVKVFQWE